jgi:5-methylcytosine-specific restriction endonuclease McrA
MEQEKIEKIKKLFYDGIKLLDIGIELDIPKSNVSYWVKKLGLKRNPITKRISDVKVEIDKEILNDLINKMSLISVSKKLKVSITTIRYYIKKYNLTRIKDSKLCKFCGNKINKKNMFCNIECEMNWKFENITYKRFLNGEIHTPRTLMSVLSKKIGYKCQTCGNDGNWMYKKLSLQIHHIDGDSLNNKPDNLTILCPNCHTQTDSWGIKNEKIGRRKLNKK